MDGKTVRLEFDVQQRDRFVARLWDPLTKGIAEEVKQWELSCDPGKGEGKTGHA